MYLKLLVKVLLEWVNSRATFGRVSIKYFSIKRLSELVLQFSPFSGSFLQCMSFFSVKNSVSQGQNFPFDLPLPNVWQNSGVLHFLLNIRFQVLFWKKSLVFMLPMSKFRVFKVLRVYRHRLLITFWMFIMVTIEMDLGQNVKLYQFNRVLYNAFSFICTNFETTVSLIIKNA